MPETLPDLFAADGVLFDLDGVLTPTAEVHMRAWKAVFDEVFERWDITPAYSDEDYFDFVDGKKRYDGVASLMRSRNVEVPWGAVDDPPEADTICGIGNRKNAAFAVSLRGEGIAPFPGSLALIERLQAAGIPLGVVSSSKNAEEVLAAAGIRSFFRVVVDGVVAERDHLASKPAPDMFRAGAEALGVDPAHSVAVEDATSGAASAAAAGFATVVGVDRGTGADSLRAAGATFVVDDLDAFVTSSHSDSRSDSDSDSEETA
ncbi:beta-phosphoglucomutase family hydrolase [Microbacterium sp. SD291]|uniref:beta-phosphoglucomutase family hydrolase n=1 Tax=Microbacterium sp. SD291 TaxID=2782007 RepID=UPI001A978BB2|nr:beta-phosphoglucomutase family hydrolase [Microbacterium sp. SD291]MBO0979919.1 beta-phosphoglucomutase family hydrolase [Microbacterium sp. SD291]